MNPYALCLNMHQWKAQTGKPVAQALRVYNSLLLG